jgi:hypothetical protein
MISATIGTTLLLMISAAGDSLEGLELMKARHRIEVSQREQASQDRSRQSAIEQEQQQDQVGSGPKKVATTPEKPLRKPKPRRVFYDNTPVWIVQPPMMPEYWIGPPIR